MSQTELPAGNYRTVTSDTEVFLCRVYEDGTVTVHDEGDIEIGIEDPCLIYRDGSLSLGPSAPAPWGTWMLEEVKRRRMPQILSALNGED